MFGLAPSNDLLKSQIRDHAKTPLKSLSSVLFNPDDRLLSMEVTVDAPFIGSAG